MDPELLKALRFIYAKLNSVESRLNAINAKLESITPGRAGMLMGLKHEVERSPPPNKIEEIIKIEEKLSQLEAAAIADEFGGTVEIPEDMPT